MDQQKEGAQGILTQICVKCGKEYYYDRQPPPAKQTCERCGNQVFRSFFAVTDNDEAEQDVRDSTERDTDADDGATDITPSDLADLNKP